MGNRPPPKLTGFFPPPKAFTSVVVPILGLPDVVELQFPSAQFPSALAIHHVGGLQVGSRCYRTLYLLIAVERIHVNIMLVLLQSCFVKCALTRTPIFFFFF